MLQLLLPASLFIAPLAELQTRPAPAPAKRTQQAAGDCYKVVKIDSITTIVKFNHSRDDLKMEGVYLIYAQREQRIYKITSPRKLISDRKYIEVGKCYRFQLHNWFDPEPIQLGEPVGGVIVNGAEVQRDTRAGHSWDFEDLFYDTRLSNLSFKHVRSKKTLCKECP